MDAASDSLSLLRGAFGPYILVGETNRKQDRGLAYRPKPEAAYSAVLIEDGQFVLTEDGQRKTSPGPAGVILWPGDGRDICVTPGSTWSRLTFDVMHQPRRLGGRRLQHHTTDACQPTPEEIWDCVPAPIVPDPLLPQFRNMMRYATSHWWGTDMDYARSNARLGVWLLDWAESFASPEGAPPDDLISRVERQTIDALHTHITVAEMAEMAGMSRRHFHDVYLEQRRIAPGEFLRQQRQEKAMGLLRTTDYRIARIAEFCGFGSLASFSRSFKAATGMTPSQWRRANAT